MELPGSPPLTRSNVSGAPAQHGQRQTLPGGPWRQIVYVQHALARLEGLLRHGPHEARYYDVCTANECAGMRKHLDCFWVGSGDDPGVDVAGRASEMCQDARSYVDLPTEWIL